LCLCSQPSLTERTVDDHRQLHARYGAMGSALRGRLANILLHHVGGHDQSRVCAMPEMALMALMLSGMVNPLRKRLEAGVLIFRLS